MKLLTRKQEYSGKHFVKDPINWDDDVDKFITIPESTVIRDTIVPDNYEDEFIGGTK